MGRQFIYRFRWLEGVLLPISYLLLLGAGVLVVRPAVAGSASVTDYLPGVAALVAGLFGLALCELLGAVHELHAGLARQEFNRSGYLPAGGRKTDHPGRTRRGSGRRGMIRFWQP